MQVRGAPPFASAEGQFRAGVGTDQFRLRDGSDGSVTCGPGHPCQVVLKVQYPGGFGFTMVPIDYA
ncbi:MAG: hypothetical protein ACRD0D_10515 [Acidimicrobiales bacterium]